MKRVLIIEDLPAARDWLVAGVQRAFPESRIETVGDCAGAKEALGRSWPDMARRRRSASAGEKPAATMAICIACS